MTLQEQIQQEVDAGYVRAFRHPTVPLTGYNYTPICAFEKHWNPITIQCRGLVLDDQGDVVARPFNKFFNYEELTDSQRAFQPQDIDQILNKEDGSLIIVFWYKNQWVFMTRGSFSSTQAQAAEKLWDHRDGNIIYTHLLELTGPSNLNVCHYEQDRLVLLGKINIETGEELSYYNLIRSAVMLDCNCVQDIKYTPVLFDEVQNSQDPNFEGIVVKLRNGLRFKLKSKLYCNLHRLVTGEWTHKRLFAMWQSRYENRFILDETIPDEWYEELNTKLNEIEDYWKRFQAHQKEVIQHAKTQLIVCRTMNNSSDHEARKLIAQTIPDARPYLNILFREGIYSTWDQYQDVVYKLFCRENGA